MPNINTVDKYTITKKKADDLYTAIYEEIMQVRVKIGMQRTNVDPKQRIEEIEDWLAELSYKAPQVGVDVFKVKAK